MATDYRGKCVAPVEGKFTTFIEVLNMSIRSSRARKRNKDFKCRHFYSLASKTNSARTLVDEVFCAMHDIFILQQRVFNIVNPKFVTLDTQPLCHQKVRSQMGSQKRSNQLMTQM